MNILLVNIRPDPVQKSKIEYSPLGQGFNKGLNSNEREEGLLKRLKNIEDKTDNQLDLIRDPGDKQLDLISEANTDRTKSIGFKGIELAELGSKIKTIEKEIRKNKRSNDKEKDKAVFPYTATDNTSFNFNDYTKLLSFVEGVYIKDLSFDETKKEQEEILKKIMGRNTKPDSNGGKVKGFLKDLEYIIFGAQDKFLKEFN